MRLSFKAIAIRVGGFCPFFREIAPVKREAKKVREIAPVKREAKKVREIAPVKREAKKVREIAPVKREAKTSGFCNHSSYYLEGVLCLYFFIQ